MKSILAAGAALGTLGTLAHDATAAAVAEKPTRKRKAKAEAAPAHVGQTKKATMPKDPKWTRRVDPKTGRRMTPKDWIAPYYAARGISLDDATQPRKFTRQAAKKKAMRDKQPGGAAAVTGV